MHIRESVGEGCSHGCGFAILTADHAATCLFAVACRFRGEVIERGTMNVATALAHMAAVSLAEMLSYRTRHAHAPSLCSFCRRTRIAMARVAQSLADWAAARRQCAAS